MSSEMPFKVITRNDDPNAYNILPVAYLDWVHEIECDSTYNKVVQIGDERRYVTFLRDDSIGDPKDRDKDDQIPLIREISRSEGTDVFFPVYYFHSSTGETNGKGGTCRTVQDCISAAEHDLGKLVTHTDGTKMMWAAISINGNVAVPITPDFSYHTVSVSGFKLTVGENRLNREPEYHLNPGTHEGAVVGTFMYLRNFKRGEYVLYFGGIASNFITRSAYKMHVN